MSTGFVWHELYMWHDTGSGAGPDSAAGMVEPDEHGESPASKRRMKNLLEVSGLLDQLQPLRPRPASVEELARVHATDYIEQIRRLSDVGGGDAGEHTPFAGGGYEIAALAAGGCLRAVEAVLAGEVTNAYALVRPPGHHAERDRGRGFCIFNNVAVAARHARSALGLERVAIVDWDVHWGNGIQQAFYEDPSVLTISIHQDDRWPRGGGNADERGSGAGAGFHLNVPLPPGTGEGGYLATIDRVVLPALESFAPELILVSCGFDASALDPFGRMLLTSSDFAQMTDRLRRLAKGVCDGRLVLCHEGGYSTAYVPFCGLATIEAMSDLSSGVVDPFLTRYAGVAYSQLQPAQDAVIETAERATMTNLPEERLSSTPTVVPLSTVKPRRRNDDYQVARLIDRERCGSELLMGVEYFAPGETTRWSFEAEDRTGLDEEWFGERDETYFVIEGRLRIEWDGGAVEFGAGDGVHIPPGNRYRLESLGPESATIVYAIAPSL